MLLFIFYLVSHQLLFPFTIAGKSAAYTPIDYILISCGASSDTRSEDGRKWGTDERFNLFTSNPENISFISTAPRQDHSVTQVPYMTARAFRDKFTYSFQVSPGLKFLRLYFYPVEYSSFDGTTSFFSVTANNYILLKNFSAYLTASAIIPPQVSLIKEFIVPVLDKERLNVTFSPSPNTFAFVNGIEFVSIPNTLYGGNKEKSLHFVNSKIPFNIPITTAFETAYRLNVGGQDVANIDDTGMFRTWHDDSTYIFGGARGTTPHLSNATITYTQETPAYTAPPIVYSTSRTMCSETTINMNYNLTWNFPIDTGFIYLLRLHFCETQLEVMSVGQRVFDIYINNQTADLSVNVIDQSGGNSKPMYIDYVVLIPNKSGQSKQVLWLALHPSKDVGSKFADAILNGLEIFRLNKSDGSLVVPNPEPNLSPTPKEPYQGSPVRKKKKGCSQLVMIITIAVFSGAFALSLIICFFIFKHKRKVKDSAVSITKSSWGQVPCPSNSTCTTSVSLLPSDLSRRFSIVEIKEATFNFDQQFIIGTGGFGHVYKGCIDGGSTTVAIKRLDSTSRQGTREFQTELELLSKLRHVNLVSLIGFCDDHGEMILVYEYMPRGTLRDHLYKTKNPPIPWKRRLEICIGAARGLHYLHAGVKHPIIHRDIKSTNILLDENWVAKVSDFGLSRVGPTNMFQSHVSTVVKGSVGYVDPEYYGRQQLTEKSDVYSFGVVLFEVLCARPSMIPGLPKDQVSLARFAKIFHARGTLEQIIDPNLVGDISPLCLKKFALRQDHSVTQVPYMTARDFRDKFTYSFSVSPGLKFLRLYFYSVEYSSIGGTTSFFSVTANNYILLKNFSAYLTASAITPPQVSFIKEFIVPVLDKGRLNVTFSPSPNSFAFVNGIEVVSIPNNLYGGNKENSLLFVYSKIPFDIPITTAFETTYRLNVGGQDVANVEDTGMFRTWHDDSTYIFGAATGVTPHLSNATITYTQETPAYTAPPIVYSTSRTMGRDPTINMNYNPTWNFAIDTGFSYLLRLHFCETQLEVMSVGQRVFDIYINNQTADVTVDVIDLSGGIFRLNKSDGGLVVPNPEPNLSPTPKETYQGSPVREKKKLKFSLLCKASIGAVLGSGATVSICLLFSFIFWRQKRLIYYKRKSMERRKASPLPDKLCQCFTLAEIQAATSNFDDSFVIGRGGFGNVCKGFIKGIKCAVAIKRLNSLSQQGAREFLTEIQMLSQLRSIHLVSLIGYCNDNNEMILVYDYMANGTLRDHLYNSDKIPLSWKRRLEICIGAAHGLDYLHSGKIHRIIHRDVKSTNILLDENYVAKVSDFGLAKMSPISMTNVPVTTVVKGTFGYMDPEYYRRQQLTEKSDVYSFGVVLFEVLYARPAVDSKLEYSQISLADWARKCVENETSLTNSAPYTPTDYILLNCGASSNTTSDDGRNWVGDADYKYSSSSSKTSSFASIASYKEPSVTEVPYMTARIFHGKFTYKFPVSSGPKFLRLYFYPNEYPGLDITTSFFSVTANNYTLSDNFSAYLVSVSSPPQAFIIKEFVIAVSKNQMLNVTFTPSPNSFAFVNGIEVVSMPTNLYTGQTYGNLRLVDTDYFFKLDNTTALETAYRLNVGGRDLLNVKDSGMFRTWHQDSDYIFGSAFGVAQYQLEATIKYTEATPAYTAPDIVYKTSRTMGPTPSINLNYNLTWLFTVDSGFYYLVRLHFCENALQLVNQRVFGIFINNHTAEEGMDVIAWSKGNDIPIYLDYVVWVSQSKKDLWVALHPHTGYKPEFYDAILNGLEIFKLNKSDGSLAAPNPQVQLVGMSPMLEQKLSKKKSKFFTRIKVIIGATLGSIVSVLTFSFIFWKRKHLLYKKKSLSRRKVSPSLEGIRCKHFSLSEILTATNNFDDALIVGRGGFGNVYKGHIQGIQYEVAIKRFNSNSHQGENEFWAEIEMLSQLRYINLVSLIGYCNDNHEMILVYDYMVNGTLRDHLYNNDSIPLQWKQRLQICIGAARGLDYLHSGAVQRIIHRDVKTTNILLDEKWVAKVSDFGLSKMGPIIMANVPITTMVKGTFGYMDPEYFRRLQLTEKSDVYSFGVVLFEVLCARPAVDIKLEDEQIAFDSLSKASCSVLQHQQSRPNQLLLLANIGIFADDEK
ncbi:hypothetical protein CRYUN_Cryun20dG0120100 [Craigia yunnanensis]